MASAANKKKLEEQNLKTLRELTSLEYNKKCLECSQRGITYADMNTSGFVCVQCSGYLRGLNPPHRVKSISMTTFSEAEIEALKKGGNESSRKVWLGKWNPKRDREPDKSDENAFKQYLISKYERRTWYISPTEVSKEETGKTGTKPEPKILPPPSSKTTTTERPRGASQPTITAQTTHSPAAHTASLPPAAISNKPPKMDLLGELEGDPFAPKQPPVGGVSVLPQIPQGGVPLVAANTTKIDEFGAFTGATPTGSLAPSSLTSLTQTSSALSKSESDKYAALASLDQTLRDLQVKDEPPHQPVPVPVSQSQSQPFGAFGGGGTNPFGASSGSAQAVSNPFMAAGSPGQQQQQHIVQQQPSGHGFAGQQHTQSVPQGYPGQQQVTAQGFGGQQQRPPGVQGFGGQQQRPAGVQGFGGQQQRPAGVQGFGGQPQTFQGSGFAGKPQGFGQPQPQQFGAFGQQQQQQQPGSPASNPYMQQQQQQQQRQQWGQAQAQHPQGQMQPGGSFGSIQQPQSVPGQQSQWRPQQGQQWGGTQMGPGAQFGTQQTGFGGGVQSGAQQSAFGGGAQQPARFGGVPQQQSGGFGAQKSQQYPGQQQQQYGGFVSAQPQVPQQGSTGQVNWGASTATTPASQTRTGSIPSSGSGTQPASVSGWSSSTPASSNQTANSLGWSTGLEKPVPQSTWGVQAQPQPQQSQPAGGSTWSSSIVSGGGGVGGMPQQQNANWGVNPGMAGGTGFASSGGVGGQMNWGSSGGGGGGFGGMQQQQPQQGFIGGGVQQGSTANPFAATSQSTTNPFL